MPRPGALKTERQVSAGGIAFRPADGGVEVALISVGDPPRWQLPKGLVDPGETPEQAAVRETREEAGVETRVLGPLEVIDYWYVAKHTEEPVRYHKFVHLFLLEYQGGDVRDHDHEVNEARWFPLAEAVTRLAFPSERKAMEKARALIEAARTDG
jgi:8-oxo-dGTP pyrophosphatase MutT (NUDIX family)